jgi:hypothetical protein
LGFGVSAMFRGGSTRKIHGTPQKSLWILLDFLVRIEPFQGVALTPRPEISFTRSSPRNNGTRSLISRDRAPGGVRRRRLACAVDRLIMVTRIIAPILFFRKKNVGELFSAQFPANRG